MSAVSLPVSRPAGRALIIASAGARPSIVSALERLGFMCGEADDPYFGLIELCRRPLAFRAVVLGLNSLFKEELLVIQTIKERRDHLDVWLTQSDGRHGALAEAMRMGADGFLDDDGLHRVSPAAGDVRGDGSDMSADESVEPAVSEPVLTADELRALLQETPVAKRAQ